MDSRLVELFSRQQAAGFPGLAGSETRTTIRISTELLNQAIAGSIPADAAVRDVTVAPHAANQIGVRLSLAKPAFLPAANLTLVIERQPQLPADPVLVLHITGGGGLLRFAGPAIAASGKLPPGVRLDGDRVFVDVRTMLQPFGQGALLDCAEQLQVTSEEGALVLLVHARVGT